MGDFGCILQKYIGQTVTIYCKCGGDSGDGFTGVLIAVDDCFVRLLTCIGGSPSCALGSACACTCNRPCRDCRSGGYGGYGYGGYGYGGSGCGNYLGSVTEIPVASIATFVHNAI